MNKGYEPYSNIEKGKIVFKEDGLNSRDYSGSGQSYLTMGCLVEEIEEINYKTMTI
jgi:hypothetical protein